MQNLSNRLPINISETEIELEDFSKDLDINGTLIENKKKKSKFHLYETNWQCPGITMAGCSCFLGLVGAAITAIGLLIATTQTDVSYQWSGYAIAVIGAGILAYSLVNFVAHCITCAAIGHYVPRRAFETNVGLLNVQNRQLAQSLEILRNEKNQWQSLVEGQKNFSQHQQEMNKHLSETLQNYSNELSNKIRELQECLQKLKQAEDAASILEKQLHEIKSALINFGETNSQFKKNLFSLDFMTEELKEQELEWDNDLKDFSKGINDYERLNNQADQLRTVLDKQLNVMEMFREAFDNGFKKLAEQNESLDISDDKFKEATAQLLEVTKEKEKAIETNNKLMQTLERVITVLNEFEDPRFNDLKNSLIDISETSLEG